MGIIDPIKDKHNLAGLLYIIKLASQEEGFPFRIRLQKILLLAKLKYGFPFTLDYQSHFYGPYAADLQGLLNFCIFNGLVREETKEIAEDKIGYFYFITDEGNSILKKINFSHKELKKIDSVWERYKSSTTEDLVREAKDVSGIKSIDE